MVPLLFYQHFFFFLHYQYYNQLSKEGKVLYWYKNRFMLTDLLKGCLGPHFENHWSKPFSFLCPFLNLSNSLKFSLPKPLCSCYLCICILMTLAGSTLRLVLPTFYLSCLSHYFPNFLSEECFFEPLPTSSSVISRVSYT